METLLSVYLNSDVVSIVCLYLRAIKRDWYHIGLAEEYDSCMNCPGNYFRQRSYYGACRSGNHKLISMLETRGAEPNRFALQHACRGGHISLVQAFHIFATKPQHWNILYQQSARGNHLDVIHYLAKHHPVNWNYVLLGAARGGHLDLVKEAISKGASNDSAIDLAARGGSIDIVKLLQNDTTEWDEMLTSASYGGHKDLVQFVLSKGATVIHDAAYLAHLRGHHNLGDFLDEL